MSNNMAKIADARKTVEQLKLEVNIDRIMVRLLNSLVNVTRQNFGFEKCTDKSEKSSLEHYNRKS